MEKVVIQVQKDPKPTAVRYSASRSDMCPLCFFITFVVSVTALAPNETAPSPNAFAIMSASALPLRYPGSAAWFDSEEYRAKGPQANCCALLRQS